MKVLSVQEAEGKLAKLCEEVLAGEQIRLQMPNGATLELNAGKTIPKRTPFTDEQLAECYNDPEWATFENNCAKASR